MNSYDLERRFKWKEKRIKMWSPSSSNVVTCTCWRSTVLYFANRDKLLSCSKRVAPSWFLCRVNFLESSTQVSNSLALQNSVTQLELSARKPTGRRKTVNRFCVEINLKVRSERWYTSLSTITKEMHISKKNMRSPF